MASIEEEKFEDDLHYSIPKIFIKEEHKDDPQDQTGSNKSHFLDEPEIEKKAIETFGNDDEDFINHNLSREVETENDLQSIENEIYIKEELSEDVQDYLDSRDISDLDQPKIPSDSTAKKGGDSYGNEDQDFIYFNLSREEEPKDFETLQNNLIKQGMVTSPNMNESVSIENESIRGAFLSQVHPALRPKVKKVIQNQVIGGHSCEDCKVVFKNKSELTKHKLLHSHSRHFTCEQCNKSFTHRSRLDRHLLVHSGIKPYTCQHCNASFTQRSSLHSHLLIHSGEKPFTCQHCSKSFTQRSSLYNHLLIHSDIKAHACKHCNKSFTQKCSLDAHLRIHSGVKPFTCEQCNMSFTHKSSLDRHLRVHSGVKPYNCHHCNKSFTHSYNLDAHLNIHSGVKPFSCKQCDKNFTHRSSLDRHLLLHSGVKAFTCDQCNKSFTQRHNLNRHLLIH